MLHRTLTALLLLLPLAAAPAASAAGSEDDLRDTVTLAKGGVLRGRVLERYGDEEIVLYVGTNQKKIAKKDVAEIRTVRDALDDFLLGHSPNQTIEEEWARVQLAKDLQLPEMADVQAWRVLVMDPQHKGANEHLGHPLHRGEYRWLHGKRRKKDKLTPEDFNERIREWKTRFRLESEHYIVETDTSIDQAIATLFDLELVYLYWMDTFGEEINAGEDVYVEDHKMTAWIYRDIDDDGFKLYYNSNREPLYDPSQITRTELGNPNLLLTYYSETSGDRPLQLFDLAVQQLMYSTLVLSRRDGWIPNQQYTIPAHWAELGFGYWLGRQFGGRAGYARHQPFVAEARNRNLANLFLSRGPLSNGSKRREVTNLIGLERRYYYILGDDHISEIYRAKARSFFRFLIEQDPNVVVNNRVVGSGRQGLMQYLREVYISPTSHSTSAFDKALGGKVELLYEPWVRWRL